MNPHLNIVLAKPKQIDEYLEFLEEVALWLDERGINQWTSGIFHKSQAYYSQSIEQGECWLAYSTQGPTELIGTIRVLHADPIAWPEIIADDGVYVYNLAVKRTWAGEGVGEALLSWADFCAHNLERQNVRLDCMADNDFLKSYYLGAGFIDCGMIDAQYPAPIGTLKLHRFERSIAS